MISATLSYHFIFCSFNLTDCVCVDETNLPADIPSYLSSQGTLAERQDSYIPSDNSSGHQYISASVGGFYIPPKDLNSKKMMRK